MALTKVTCTRCDGSGKFSYNLTRGTVCFLCNGSKVTLVDLVKQAKAKQAKAIRDAAKAVDQKSREDAGNARFASQVAKYSQDARIGPVTRAKCISHDQYAYQTYQTLEAVDNGSYGRGNTFCAVFPSKEDAQKYVKVSSYNEYLGRW